MFTEKECMAIMQPILAAGLPAMGIVRMMARVVVHGPICYQGLNIPNLYMEQLLAWLQALLQYGQKAKDVMGSLLHYTAEAFQMEVGVTGAVFEAPIALAPAVTDSWITECWLDMAHHDIHVKEDIPDFNVPQAGDGELMLAFMKAGFWNEDIAILN